MKQVYETLITNHGGTSGVVSADNGYSFNVAPVLKADSTHTNPEQLIGSAWATCLNATIISIIKAKKLDLRSRVEVKVKLWFDEKTRYSFTLDGFAAIENLEKDEVQKIVDFAHKLCPVSKLIGKNPGVTLTVVGY